MIYPIVFLFLNILIAKLLSQFNVNIILFPFIYYNYLEWIMHKIAHSKKFGGDLYTLHYNHHKLYSGTNLVMDEPYIGSGGDIIFIQWVPSIWISIYISFPLYFTILFIIQTSMLMWLSNYMHEQFHITDSWLLYNKFTKKWFLFARKKHFIHHSCTWTNMSLGGLSYLADYTLGTYR